MREGYSKVPSKDPNKKHQNNLIIGERNAIREITNNTKFKVYPFDKGSGFVIMKEEEAIKGTEEPIGKLKIIHYDPISTLMNKFRKQQKKTMAFAITPTQRKSRGYLILD